MANLSNYLVRVADVDTLVRRKTVQHDLVNILQANLWLKFRGTLTILGTLAWWWPKRIGIRFADGVPHEKSARAP